MQEISSTAIAGSGLLPGVCQGSEEWFRLRLGKVTASRVADVVAKTRTGASASRANYMAELIVERLTGVSPDRYANDAMKWGTQTEPDARVAYEFHNNVVVDQIGFVSHPTIPMSGASPDGLVGDSGLLEIKCPISKTHIETLLGRNVPGQYMIQMQWQMACTGRQWCDFASYDPRMPEHMRLWVCRVHRDAEHIEQLEGAVRAFLVELDDRVTELRAAYPEPTRQAAE